MHRKFLIPVLLLVAGALSVHAAEEPKPRMLTDKEVRALVLALDDPLARFDALTMYAYTQPNPVLFEPIRKLCDAKEPGVRWAAAQSLAYYGAKATPTLARMLNDRNSRDGAVEVVGAVRSNPGPVIGALINLLTDPERDTRLKAEQALGWLGEKASDAIAPLTKMLKEDPDSDVRQTAAWALRQTGEKAIAPLTTALAAPNSNVRRCAADALGEMGPKAESAIEPLMKLLDDPSMNTRQAAAVAIGHLGPKAQTAVGPLIVLLKQTNPHSEARFYVGEALGNIGEASLEPLITLLTDPEPGKRLAAAEAMNHVLVRTAGSPGDVKSEIAAEKSAKAIEPLIALLGDTDPRTRRAAAEALWFFGDKADEAAKPLLKLLGEDDSNVRNAAAKTLGHIGTGAQVAIEPLIKLLQDPKFPDSRQAVAEALGQFGDKAEKAIGPLTLLLADHDSQYGTPTALAQAASDALASIGEKSIEPLIKMLVDPSPVTRQMAARTLGKMGYRAEKAIEPLCKLLRYEDRESHDAAASALGQIGEKAVEPLSRFVSDPSAFARQGAVSALASIGFRTIFLSDPDTATRDKAANRAGMSGEKPMETQVRLFTAQDPQVRKAAAEELHRIGERIIDLLIQFLHDADSYTRSQAAMRLGELGPRAKRAVEPLIKLLADKDSYVSYCAARSLLELKDTRPIDMASFITAFRHPEVPPDPSYCVFYSLLLRQNVKATPAELCQLLEVAHDKPVQRSGRVLDAYFVADDQNRPLVRWLGGRSDADLPAAAGLTHDQAADLLKQFTVLLPHASDSPHVRKEIADRIVRLSNTASWSHADLDALRAARDAMAKAGQRANASELTKRVESLERSQKTPPISPP
jgi:HEAT repeat protein